ncbi:helix-turn-helix domain-containing protein [Bifidobacterium catenulatum]|nr:helix-turn-helix domain-containing protein [Bifidobacterium catenulatum]
MRRLYDSRTVTVDQIAAMMRVGRSTVYRCLNASDDTNAE